MKKKSRKSKKKTRKKRNVYRANTSGIFTDGSVADGVDQDLDGVLLGHQVDDLERVLDNAKHKEKQ